MAKTGLVPLRKKNIDNIAIKVTDDYDEKEPIPQQVNLGGIAQARRPDWPDWSVGNLTQRRNKPNRNRKPTFRDPVDDDEVLHVKKKQSSSPWFLNLAGPPG